MNPELMEYLACPVDRHMPLKLNADKVDSDGDIVEGTIICTECQKTFIIKESIPMFAANFEESGDESEVNRIKAKEQRMRDDQATEYDSHILEVTVQEILKCFEPLIKLESNHNLLDLGCGTGRITVKMAEKSKMTIGVDFSFNSLKVFQGRIPVNLRKKIHLVQADISELPFRDFIFHRVLSNSVYQHVPGFFNEPHHILEVARMLCDDGVFVLSIYNYSFIRAFLARLIPAVSYGVGYEKEGFHSGKIYFRRYEWKELKKILEATFEIKYLTGIQNIPKLVIKIFGSFALVIDSLIQRMFISRYTGYHLLASGRKRSLIETSN